MRISRKLVAVGLGFAMLAAPTSADWSSPCGSTSSGRTQLFFSCQDASDRAEVGSAQAVSLRYAVSSAVGKSRVGGLAEKPGGRMIQRPLVI